MTDEHDKLRAVLNQLETQIAALRERDPAATSQLEATMAEARAALAGKPMPQSKQRSVAQRLGDAVLQYEASHPSLAGNLGAIIDALGRMGI